MGMDGGAWRREKHGAGGPQGGSSCGKYIKGRSWVGRGQRDGEEWKISILSLTWQLEAH